MVYRQHPPPPLEGLTVNVCVHQGRNLVAKDKNLFGKKRSSDPYVQVSLLGKVYGVTSVKSKTLAPVWNEKIKIVINGEQQTKSAIESQLILSIWDHDKMSDSDPMGVVSIPFTQILTTSSDNILQQFFVVEKGSGKMYCKNATGELEVSISISGRQVLSLVPGNNHPLSGHSSLLVGLSWDIEHGQNIDLDASCVAISRNTGEILMNDTVYYGNLANRNRSVFHSGDELTGLTTGDDEVITCRLHEIPFDVYALYFILSVVTPNKTFQDVKSARVRVVDKITGKPICQFAPSELGHHSSIFLARLYRTEGRATNEWMLSPIEEGHATSRDFGTLIPQIKSYSRDIVPNVRIDPNERVAIMRKNGVIRISDYCSAPSNESYKPENGRTLPEWLTFGLAWDITNGKNIDLDASVICLDSNLQVKDLVWFRQLKSLDGAIVHSGDEREGDALGDDEKINLSLNFIDPDIQYIGIVVNSFSGQELDDIASASCHLFDTNTKKDIAVYALTNASALDKHTALVMGCLYRSATGDWLLRIISEPAQGRTVNDNVDELQNFLRRNPPVEPTIIVEVEDEEAEIDLSTMPPYVPHNEEADIVIVPAEDLKQYIVHPHVVGHPDGKQH